MDRSLDDMISERQRGNGPRGRRGGRYDDRSRETARKPPFRDEDSRDLDRDDWVHDRYEDDSYTRHREPRDYRDRRRERDRYEPEEIDRPGEPTSKLRVDNLHYDLNETDLRELFNRIGPVRTASILYDRSDRSKGTAYVTYADARDASRAVREFDGANALGQPLKLTLLPSGPGAGSSSRAPPASGRSLFDRIGSGGADASRGGSTRRARSVSPRATAAPRDRREEVLRQPAPEGVDRYIPGSDNDGAAPSRRRGPRSRSPPRRRGGGGGSAAGVSAPRGRTDAAPRPPRRDEDGRTIVQGRPRKTAEELDAEMADYWGGGSAAAVAVGGGGGDSGLVAGAFGSAAGGAPAAPAAPVAGVMQEDDIEMVE